MGVWCYEHTLPFAKSSVYISVSQEYYYSPGNFENNISSYQRVESTKHITIINRSILTVARNTIEII